MKTVLVAGSARSLNEEAKEAARAVGAALAENGFGLVTGSWPGVDQLTASAFMNALARGSLEPAGRYTQLHYRRWQPFSTARLSDSGLRKNLQSGQQATQEMLRLCDAAILIGGLGGVKEIAFEFVSTGRPIFPLPLTGGDALLAYAETLERWADRPVPGMTQSQFMSLSLPIGGRANGLMRLLRAALQDTVDVFVSYRRSDVPGAAGRIAERLGEHFGPRRVFLDTQSIAPGAAFPREIEEALRQCRVMVCVIGPRWELSRLRDPRDYVRRELEVVLEAGTPVMPILAFGGAMPAIGDLPESLRGLLQRQAVKIEDNGTWEPGVHAVLVEADRIVGDAAVPSRIA